MHWLSVRFYEEVDNIFCCTGTDIILFIIDLNLQSLGYDSEDSETNATVRFAMLKSKKNIYTIKWSKVKSKNL